MRLAVMLLALVSLAAGQAVRQGRGRGVARDNSPPDANAPTTESLLRIVHDEAQQLGPADRAALLSRAIQSVDRAQPDLVQPWTEELFGLAPQIPEERRASLEMTPVTILARSDVEAAMKLLERMDAPAGDTLLSGNDPRTGAANAVFPAYWNDRPRGFRRRGGDDPAEAEARLKQEEARKLDRLRSIAGAMGATGVYPYSAFSGPLMSLKISQPPAQEALFAELLNAFRSSPGRYADINEFERMLLNERGQAPAGLLREALTMTVAAIDRLPVNNLPTISFTFRSQATTGELNNAASLLLTRILPLLRQVDPEWAKRVTEQHQDVANFEQSRNGPGTIVTLAPGVTMSGPPPSPNRSPQRQLGPVRAAAQSSGEAAKVFLGLITDPNALAAANAEIAAGLAAENPQEAASYLTKASQALSSIDDPAAQLMVVTSLARAAFETGDRASAVAYSERGFRLGEDVVHADYDASPDKSVMSLKGVSDLQTLVTTSMRIDPAGTVSRIGNIRYPVLRVNLLLSAADALQRRGGNSTIRVSGARRQPPDSAEHNDAAPAGTSVTGDPAAIEVHNDRGSRPMRPPQTPASPPLP